MGQLDGNRSAAMEKKRNILEARRAEANLRAKNHQAKRSGSNYDQVRVDEEHAYTSMQSALLRAAYGNEAKGQRHGSEERQPLTSR